MVNLEADIRSELTMRGIDYRTNEDGLTAEEWLTQEEFNARIVTGPVDRFWYVERFPHLPSDYHAAVLQLRVDDRFFWSVLAMEGPDGSQAFMASPNHEGSARLEDLFRIYDKGGHNGPS